MSLLMLRNIQDIQKGNHFPMASRGMYENGPPVGTISLAKNRQNLLTVYEQGRYQLQTHEQVQKWRLSCKLKNEHRGLPQHVSREAKGQVTQPICMNYYLKFVRKNNTWKQTGQPEIQSSHRSALELEISTFVIERLKCVVFGPLFNLHNLPPFESHLKQPIKA